MTDNLSQTLNDVANRLRAADRVLCLTGAGVSAESGVPTFRDPGGLWEGVRPEEVATPEAFAHDPEFVWRFYQHRRKQLLSLRPNRAHEVTARFESVFETFNLVTQNVDGLHQQAKSKSIISLHGDIWIDRCTVCGFERRVREISPAMPRCNKCHELARPGVVWFGEMLPPGAIERAADMAAEAEVVLVVGTSSQVYPAASLSDVAKSSGAFVVEINPASTALTANADAILAAPAGEVLPQLEQRIA